MILSNTYQAGVVQQRYASAIRVKTNLNLKSLNNLKQKKSELTNETLLSLGIPNLRDCYTEDEDGPGFKDLETLCIGLM